MYYIQRRPVHISGRLHFDVGHETFAALPRLTQAENTGRVDAFARKADKEPRPPRPTQPLVPVVFTRVGFGTGLARKGRVRARYGQTLESTPIPRRISHDGGYMV